MKAKRPPTSQDRSVIARPDNCITATVPVAEVPTVLTYVNPHICVNQSQNTLYKLYLWRASVLVTVPLLRGNKKST